MPMRTFTTRPSGSVTSCSRGPAWRLTPAFLRTLGPSVPENRPNGPWTPSGLGATLSPDEETGGFLAGCGHAVRGTRCAVLARRPAPPHHRSVAAGAGRPRRHQHIPRGASPSGAHAFCLAHGRRTRPLAADG